MKTIFFSVLLFGAVVLARAHTAMDLFLTLGGSQNTPNCSGYASGHSPINATWTDTDGFHDGLGLDACSMTVGQQVSTYVDHGHVTDGASITSVTASDTNIVIDSYNLGADSSGSPAIFVQFHYGQTSCTYNVSSTSPHTGYVPTVTFSDGETFGPYANMIQGPPGSDPSSGLMSAYNQGTAFSYTYQNMPCGLTWAVTWAFCQACEASSGMPTITNEAPAVTNVASIGQDNTSTNVGLSTVPPNTSSNLLWSAPTSTAGATTADVHDLGNGLNNTLWTMNQQAQRDDGAIVGAINAAKTLAHADALVNKSAVDSVRAQAHVDAQILHGDLVALRSVSNGVASVNLTNYALDSSVQGVANAVNTNAVKEFNLLSTNLAATAGLGGAMTNLTGAVNGLGLAISNMNGYSNLDFATEGTQEGISNLLAQGSTNWGRIPTNYALETTQKGISNVLSQMLSNALAGSNGGGGIGLTLQQLTNQVNTYTQQLANSADGALAQMSTLTNQAGVMGMNSVVSVVQGGLPGSVEYDSPAGVSPQVITLASGVAFPLGANMPSYGPLRQVLAWATIVGLFLWNWRTTYSRIRDVFTANQARTAGTELLGSNVNLSSAMLMAVAIFAVATAIPTFAVAVLTNEVTLFFSVGNVNGLFNGFGWGYHFLDQYIPLATVITAVTSRVVFNVVIDSIAAVVMGIKLFLVGL